MFVKPEHSFYPQIMKDITSVIQIVLPKTIGPNEVVPGEFAVSLATEKRMQLRAPLSF